MLTIVTVLRRAILTPAFSFLLLLFSAPLSALGQRSSSCDRLANVNLSGGTVTSVQLVSGSGSRLSTLPELKGVPPFCRVTAELTPSPDSDIKIEVWMPLSGWNGKYEGQGNGGFAGSIDYGGMAGSVSRGFATAGTDTGHAGSATDASWALGHPEKIIDFGYRAIHEMTETAKIIIKAFYGQRPKRSYFSSCSNGGREALMEAQRFPEDYDGIIAGAPANFWTHLLTAAVFDIQALQTNPESYIPAAKIPAISSAVLAACDAEDGVTDGIINDPTRCHFHPAALLCKSAESEKCLTPPQVTALEKIYAGPRSSKGEQIFPGFVPGGEEGPGGWSAWITGRTPGSSLQYAFGTNYFGDMVYENPAWDFRSFDVDKGLQLADNKTARFLNATDTNLKPFQSRGGKLILYHGWSDAAISPLNTIQYYKKAVADMDVQIAESFLRLYMVPGMQHCAGGPGPSFFGQLTSSKTAGDLQHDIQTALDQWVEKGLKPDKIVATKYVNDSDPAQGVKMTRPLCPYPQIAKYNGTGEVNDAANFVCAQADQ